MIDFGRRIVIDLEFETAVDETSRLIRQEGLKIIARVDLRDHIRRDLSRDFRRYVLIDAWSSTLAVEGAATQSRYRADPADHVLDLRTGGWRERRRGEGTAGAVRRQRRVAAGVSPSWRPWPTWKPSMWRGCSPD